MRRIALTAAIGLLLLTACGQSYEDKIEACTKTVRTHDFDAHPLKNGERLAGCEDLKEQDYNDIVFANILDDLGWVDDEGNFDKNKMIEDTLESEGGS